MLLIDGEKYEEWVPQGPYAEDEFERVVKKHAQDIFGEQSKVCIIVAEVLIRG